MKQFLIAIAAVLLFSEAAEAQNWRPGVGRWTAGSGLVVTPEWNRRYVNPYPYQYQYQYRYWYDPSIRKAPKPRLYSGTKAWADDIRERWKLEDEAKARRRAESEAKRERYRKYREAHPPKKGESYFVHRGKKYKSYSEFKESDAYADLVAERRAIAERNRIEEEIKENERREAMETLREHRLYNRPMIFLQEEDRQRRIFNRAMNR